MMCVHVNVGEVQVLHHKMQLLLPWATLKQTTPQLHDEGQLCSTSALSWVRTVTY